MIKAIVAIFLSSLCYFFAWPPQKLFFLSFVAIIPLLYVSWNYKENLDSKWFHLIVALFSSFFITNILVLGWLFKASFMGGLAICIINSVILTIPFFAFLFNRRYSNKLVIYLLFVCLWITVEYLHFRWTLAFPFLNLGYSLSAFPSIIQFYEYTGVLGGSLWILFVNVLLFEFFRSYRDRRLALRLASLLLIFLGPLVFSLYLKQVDIPIERSVNVAVLHSALDCRGEKYVKPSLDITKLYVESIKSELGEDVDLLLLPETALTNMGLISDLYYNPSYKLLYDSVLIDFPQLDLVSGAVTYELASRAEAESPNVMFDDKSKLKYKSYNAALQMNLEKKTTQIRVKNKLVPVEETIPDNIIFNLLRTILGSQGGFYFSMNTNYSDVFTSSNGIQYAPLICYESLFGDATRRMVLAGAQLILISLNECWYTDTSGSEQFMSFSSCRAIETRKAIARSSNLGRSSFTNAHGEIEFFSPQAINAIYTKRLPIYNYETFYTRHGDYIGVTAIWMFLVSLIAFWFKVYP